MDVGGDVFKHTGMTSRGLSPGILYDHSHGEALVEYTKLALWALLITRVGKDTAVKEGSVDISDHGTDVPGRVGLGSFGFGELDGINVGLAGLIPVERVALIDGVDLAAIRDTDVGVSEDELTNGRVQGVAMDGLIDGEDKIAG